MQNGQLCSMRSRLTSNANTGEPLSIYLLAGSRGVSGRNLSKEGRRLQPGHRLQFAVWPDCQRPAIHDLGTFYMSFEIRLEE